MTEQDTFASVINRWQEVTRWQLYFLRTPWLRWLVVRCNLRADECVYETP